MAKQLYYRQCKLRKNVKDGTYLEQVSYIPEPFCVIGKPLKLRDNNGIWDDGWVVISVSTNKTVETPDIHKEIRGHRNTTGDNMKK